MSKQKGISSQQFVLMSNKRSSKNVKSLYIRLGTEYCKISEGYLGNSIEIKTANLEIHPEMIRQV